MKEKSAGRREAFADIPYTYRNATWDSFKTGVYRERISKTLAESALEDAKMWVDNVDLSLSEGTGLYIFSKARGSGKTLMASIIGNELLRLGYQVKFVTTSDLLMRIRESWDNKSVRESEVVKELTAAQILIIDDIGVEGDKDWIRERFFHIVNKRYEKRKPIIYTSNAEIQRLKVDARISSRISETSFVLPFPEESIRAEMSYTTNKRFRQKVMQRRAAEQ